MLPMSDMTVVAFFPMPGPMEMIIFGIIALLLFGKRLPEVARGLGKGIVEFKKGLSDVSSEVQNTNYDRNDSGSGHRPPPPDERVETTAPKFEPPRSEPS